MQKIWEALVWFWAHYGNWIVVAFLPSIIAGLMISPQTQKAGSVLQKILDIIKKIIGFFSVLTHKDEPGTFKLPFYAGKLFVKKMDSIEEPKIKKIPPAIPPAAGLLLLILTLALPQTGCCKLFGMCDGTDQSLIDCASQAAMANAPQLLPIIKDILTGKGDGWSGRIWALIKEFGKDAVACAMQQVSQDLLTSVPPGGTEPTPEQAAALEGVKRARQFSAEQKWQFKQTDK